VSRAVPAERVRALRAALEATLKDEAFLTEAQRQSLLLDPVSGEEAEQVIAKIYSASPELAKKVKEVLD
jgi:tripartite-type tricarboxylate transporter receptor subunit TctC